MQYPKHSWKSPPVSCLPVFMLCSLLLSGTICRLHQVLHHHNLWFLAFSLSSCSSPWGSYRSLSIVLNATPLQLLFFCILLTDIIRTLHLNSLQKVSWLFWGLMTLCLDFLLSCASSKTASNFSRSTCEETVERYVAHGFTSRTALLAGPNTSMAFLSWFPLIGAQAVCRLLHLHQAGSIFAVLQEFLSYQINSSFASAHSSFVFRRNNSNARWVLQFCTNLILGRYENNFAVWCLIVTFTFLE